MLSVDYLNNDTETDQKKTNSEKFINSKQGTDIC